MTNIKCPFCGDEMKLTSLYMDGNHRYSHKYIGALSGGKDRCPFDGETLPLRALQEIHRTRKELEQSETCCSEWEKQALDYKAENIALSGDLERTRKALEIAVDALKKLSLGNVPSLPDDETLALAMCNYARDTLKQIKDKEQQ